MLCWKNCSKFNKTKLFVHHLFFRFQNSKYHKGCLILEGILNFSIKLQNHCSQLFNLLVCKLGDNDFANFLEDETRLKIPTEINPPVNINTVQSRFSDIKFSDNL